LPSHSIIIFHNVCSSPTKMLLIFIYSLFAYYPSLKGTDHQIDMAFVDMYG